MRTRSFQAKHRLPTPLLAIVFVVLFATLPTPARSDVSGAEVRRALRLGIEAIQKRQQPNGRWTEHNYPGGVTCLATLALLQAGRNPADNNINAAIQAIRKLDDRHVYVVSLKIMVLARADAVAYRPEIEASARWLRMAQNESDLWTYGRGNDTRFDHSNTQFALLGLDAAAEAGVEIRHVVWRKARRRLVRNQNKDGGWGYQANDESYGSMTAAGVADLLILGQQMHKARVRGFRNGVAPCCNEYETDRALARGLAWLARNFDARSNPRRGNAHLLYWLYAVERCGILSGQRYLAGHDWYRAGAEYLVESQQASGMWSNSTIDTCFAVLFLAKGHKSLLVQKLQWSDDDDWSPTRRDLPHLISFIGDKLGQPVTWHAIPIDAPLEDWLAAPLLFIHGRRFPEFSNAQQQKLRAFVEQGGTILAEATCGEEDFHAGFAEFAAEVFPESPLRPLGPDHAIYRLLFRVEPYGERGQHKPYAMQGIDFGCRTSVIYTPRDISCLWELATIPTHSERAFKLGANIAAYAVGRRPLIDRLDAVILPKETSPQEPASLSAFRLAQVVYEGDWRPFPMAAVNLAEFLQRELNFNIVTQYRQVHLTDEKLYASPVLLMAGHFAFELSPEEKLALSKHLRRGGFLIADACCGTDPFGSEFRQLVTELFPDATLRRLPPEHPIFRGKPGFDVTSVSYSPDVERKKPNLNRPELWGLELDGRLAIVYSPYSLSCGLSGPAFDGCWGYQSADAKRLAANIVLYALTH